MSGITLWCPRGERRAGLAWLRGHCALRRRDGVYFCAYHNVVAYIPLGCPGAGQSLLNRAVSLVGGRSRSGGAGVTGGGDDAIRALYQAYRVPLLAFALRLTGGDRQHAEDVVQETMVRAWLEAGRLDLSGPSLMPWLTAVARNIVIDEHRRKSARPREAAGAAVADRPVGD